MAKTAFSIYMDYKKTMNQANELERVARDLKSLANSNFQSSISRLNSNWTGEAASAYIKKANKLKSDMENSANSISKTSSALKTIAITTYKAEMAALALLG